MFCVLKSLLILFFLFVLFWQKKSQKSLNIVFSNVTDLCFVVSFLVLLFSILLAISLFFRVPFKTMNFYSTTIVDLLFFARGCLLKLLLQSSEIRLLQWDHLLVQSYPMECIVYELRVSAYSLQDDLNGWETEITWAFIFAKKKHKKE